MKKLQEISIRKFFTLPSLWSAPPSPASLLRITIGGEGPAAASAKAGVRRMTQKVPRPRIGESKQPPTYNPEVKKKTSLAQVQQINWLLMMFGDG